MPIGPETQIELTQNDFNTCHPGLQRSMRNENCQQFRKTVAFFLRLCKNITDFE